MQPLRLIFAGSGEFGAPTLRALLERPEIQIAQVVSQPDRAAGRGRAATPTPIAQLALARQLPLLRTDRLNNESLPPADLMLVIAFGQKLAAELVNRPRLGSINLHASILPKYRGAAPIHWAILRGETETGNSIIRLADRMDVGAVLAQSRLTIGETETAGELHDRLAQDGAGLTLKTVDALAADTAREMQQDHAQATLAPKLSRADAVIDWTAPAETVARRIRGLCPWPGCRVKLVDETGREQGRLTLLRARAAARTSAANHLSGTVLESGAVACGDAQAVEILELQPEGRRAMPLADYARGHPWRAGLRLESIG